MLVMMMMARFQLHSNESKFILDLHVLFFYTQFFCNCTCKPVQGSQNVIEFFIVSAFVD